jgi:hypothetical protein
MSKNNNPPSQRVPFEMQSSFPQPSCSHPTFRHVTLGMLLTITFSIFIFQSCGLDVEDPTPPTAPQWVPKTLPEEWPERGIDAHESGGVYLEWEQNSEEDILAYRIYRAIWFDINDSLGTYDLLAYLEIDALQKLEYVDASVQTGVRFYYKIRCEDDSNNLSAFSDSVYYTLISAIGVETMIPNNQSILTDQNRILTWRYYHGIAMENYSLTLLNEDNGLVKRAIFTPRTYTGSEERWSIPIEIDLISNRIYKWRIDLCADYVEDRETSGSESFWATFLYESSLE